MEITDEMIDRAMSVVPIERVKEATALGSESPENEWQRGWNAAMNHVRDQLGVQLDERHAT